MITDDHWWALYQILIVFSKITFPAIFEVQVMTNVSSIPNFLNEYELKIF